MTSDQSQTEARIGFFDPSKPLAHLGKKIGLAVLLLLVVIFYYGTRYSKGAEILLTLSQIPLSLIATMLAVDICFLYYQGGLLNRVYQTVGLHRSRTYTTAMYIAMNFINTVAPVAGLSGSIYMVIFERKYGTARSESILINFLYYIIDYAVFLILLLAGLLFLLFSHEITPALGWTALVYVVFVVGLCIAGYFFLTSSSALSKLLNWFNRVRFFSFFRKKSLITEEGADHFISSIRQAWGRTAHNRLSLRWAVLNASMLHVTSLLLLGLAFTAVQVPITFQILLMSYTVGTLLSIVSFTPGGIGIAEGGMTAALAAAGLPVEQALLIALLYRTIFVWFPLALGPITVQLLPLLIQGDRLENS